MEWENANKKMPEHYITLLIMVGEKNRYRGFDDYRIGYYNNDKNVWFLAGVGTVKEEDRDFKFYMEIKNPYNMGY